MRSFSIAISTMILMATFSIANASSLIGTVVKLTPLVGGEADISYTPKIAPHNIECDAITGSSARVIDERVDGHFHWLKVKILNGNCQGEEGWITLNNVSMIEETDVK